MKRIILFRGIIKVFSKISVCIVTNGNNFNYSILKSSFNNKISPEYHERFDYLSFELSGHHVLESDQFDHIKKYKIRLRVFTNYEVDRNV